MAKDYKLIYNRFKKEIEQELEAHYKQYEEQCETERQELLNKVETRYAISVLEVVLSWTEELEGKKCCMLNMNKEDFKKWKKKIKGG